MVGRGIIIQKNVIDLKGIKTSTTKLKGCP